MNKHVTNFKKDVIERMSRSYYDELLYFTAIVPDALLNFNDVILLKKGQKYISHTNNLFQKAIANMFKELFLEKGIECSVCKTDSGRGRAVYLKKERKRIHFLGQEKFVNFPRVSWFNFRETNGLESDLYSVVIKKNEKGLSFINEANQLVKKQNITRKSFIVLEDLVLHYFDANLWNDICTVMSEIEVKTKDYQWFGLVNYYNELTRTQYLKKIESKLINLPYVEILKRYKEPIRDIDLKILKHEYIDMGGYKILLGENDFCSSFITSEWLFDNLNISGGLEKTYIVTGYIKSIEQLMTYLVRKTADDNSTIGIIGAGGIKNIEVQSEEFFKATLGNLLFYMKSVSNRHIFKNQVSSAAIKKSIDIINEWIKVERNGYFHKHNIEDIDRVEEIREKTLILYFLLLASIDI